MRLKDMKNSDLNLYTIRNLHTNSINIGSYTINSNMFSYTHKSYIDS